jgi:tetratricopeptide (TPR) repeat protein/transglutaminase-like putative cysteine protease
MFKASWALALAMAAAPAFAADQPKYRPVPDWVKPIPIPAEAPAADGGAVQVLLMDSQTDFSGHGDLFFSEFAARVNSPQGLAAMGTLTTVWNPETDTVIIHRASILRGGKAIDLLAGGKKFTVLRRETNLELAMLDGRLTATLPTEGLQVGDVLDLAVTIERRDPVVQGRSEGVSRLIGAGRVAHTYFRSIWPAAKPMRWRTTEGLGEPQVVRRDGQVELVYDLKGAKTPTPPKDAPARFNDLATSEVTQYADWAEVAALVAPLYAKATTLTADSALRAEVEKIRTSSADPKRRAEGALRLVEEKVRYLFLGMNAGNYLPAAADATWGRRYGDCKGKTALLLALLHELGVEAEPVLVSTTGGDGLDQRLPMLAYFDHVMVRAVIDGKVYWLDGTRQGDRGLDDIPTPNVGWVLPVRAAGAKLEKLSPPPLATPWYDRTVRLDARAGLDKPAPADVTLIWRGDDALRNKLMLETFSTADAEKFMRAYWRGELPWVEIGKVAFAWDAARGELALSMKGQASMDWTKGDGVRDFDIADSSLGWTTSYRREPGPHEDAPYAVEYPMFKRWRVEIQLPGKGAGFAILNGADVKQTTAGIEFARTTTLKDGVVSMDATERSLAPEFPAAEADAAAKALRDLSDRDVFVRAGSAYQATLASDAPAPEWTPTTAAQFSARGAQRLNDDDYDGAIADFEQALRLEPGVGKHLYNRGVARFYKGQDDLALTDFTQALKLKPDDVLALVARGEVYLEKGDEARARADFDQAIRLSPKDPAIAVRAAGDYDRAGRFEAAVKLYDALISAAPAPAADQSARWHGARCRLRGEWGRGPAEGLVDCVAALKSKPSDAEALEGRALLNFRAGRFGQAEADFTAVLKAEPKRASALYGRGLTLAAEGRKIESAADLAAAKAADPQIAETFARYGLGR